MAEPGLPGVVPTCRSTITTGVFDSDAMKAKMPWTVAVPTPDQNKDVPYLVSAVVLCLTGLGDDVSAAVRGIGFPGFATAAGINLAFAIPGGGSRLYWHPRADGRDPLAWAVDEFLPMVEDRFSLGHLGARAPHSVGRWVDTAHC